METIVVKDEYKGNPIFGIYKMEDKVADGVQDSKPIISFGLRKARAIVNHVAELQAWITETDKEEK